MRYRGRIINAMLVEMFQLDLQQMSTDGKLDPVYHEPVIEDTDDGKTKPARRESTTPLLIPAQIEPDSFNRQTMRELGNTKAGVFAFCCHFRDLEQMGLVGDDGVARIRPGDRMSAIYRMDRKLVMKFADPPGMYVTEATPTGFGLGGDRNLLLVRLQSRG